ncbi:MAG: FMN-binding negative transcriptional regulator [Pseudobacter sp.]|uniref:FMN-binding negative transcriptional regulator n=1 Tax=Pseudobacter sp. TaxID=2045420 RepID=UPI003F81E59A
MYIPTLFRWDEAADKISFMQQYSFATIITGKGNIPVATHLPFVVEQREDQLYLSSHFAKANEHTTLIEANPSLVIFSEPHAYISPKHYDKKQSVPTWDYISAHAYGHARIIHDKAVVSEVVNPDNYSPSGSTTSVSATRPTCPSFSLTLIPLEWNAADVRIASTIP